MAMSVVLNIKEEIYTRIRLMDMPAERRANAPMRLHHYLSISWNDESYQCLCYIDPYRMIIFNRLQMPTFIAEWEKMSRLAETEEDRAMLEGVARLARRCRDEAGFFLRFIGD